MRGLALGPFAEVGGGGCGMRGLLVEKKGQGEGESGPKDMLWFKIFEGR